MPCHRIHDFPMQFTECSEGGVMICFVCSSSIGANSLLGDPRWAGLYGVEADFVAQEHCKICCIGAESVQVRSGRRRDHQQPSCEKSAADCNRENHELLVLLKCESGSSCALQIYPSPLLANGSYATAPESLRRVHVAECLAGDRGVEARVCPDPTHLREVC